jgi:hypothetical protein
VKYTFDKNIIVVVVAVFVLVAVSFNHYQATGQIDVKDAVMTAVSILLGLNGLLAHKLDPVDGKPIQPGYPAALPQTDIEPSKEGDPNG